MADSAASDVPSAIVPGEVRESPPSGTRQQGKIPIETMVRSVAIVGALFYVLGFLTTNAYLYKLGVSDFSLLRTRFILTGVLTLAPVVLALIGGIYAALDATLHGSHTRLTSRAYLWILADIALPFALYFTLFSVVAENDVGASARDAALLSAVCAVMVLALLVSLALYRKSERRPLSHLAYRGKPVSYDRFTERFGVPSGVVETTIFAVAGVVLFLAYIGLFGQYFYPTLPEQLGGGRPRMAQILVTGEAVLAVRELGLDVTEDAPLSPPVQLLWEGEESYVIRLAQAQQRSGRADRAGVGRWCRHGASSGPPRRSPAVERARRFSGDVRSRLKTCHQESVNPGVAISI